MARISNLDAAAAAGPPRTGYTTRMNDYPRKTKDIDENRKPEGGKTRPVGAPLDKELTDTFNEVQPERFRGDSRSSIEAGAVDPDVDDSIGGE